MAVTDTRSPRTSSAEGGPLGETFESTRPATGELIDFRSRTEDVDRAVEAAKAAYEEWRLVPAPARGEILYRFGALVRERKDELALLMSREMGKVLPEAGGDVQEAIDMSFYMAGEGRRLFGQTTPSELRDKFNMSVRMPIGVIGVITPWNFRLRSRPGRSRPRSSAATPSSSSPPPTPRRSESASSSCWSRLECLPES
jgi:aldehyde dehydrogenase (NAD+)